MDKIWKIGIPAILAIGFIMFVMAFSPAENPLETGKSEGITFGIAYHVTQTRDGEVMYEVDVENLITNAGLDLVRDKIGQGGAPGNVTHMALGPLNKASTAADTFLEEEFASDEGLNRSHGVYTEGINNGNWTVCYQWTATASANVGKFAVFNETWPSNASMFSVGNFSNNLNVSMLANDELTVNVTYTVS